MNMMGIGSNLLCRLISLFGGNPFEAFLVAFFDINATVQASMKRTKLNEMSASILQSPTP